MMEKPGSTRIISILPEGTKVNKGDMVCELDSSAFVDELAAQKIRWAQAKAQVEQVQYTLDVSQLTQIEYRDGIGPQDELLIRQYLQSCKTDEERARKNYVWSKATGEKGFRAPAQVKADELAVQQTQIALKEAEGMAFRLHQYTSPRLLKNLQAKIEAIRADKLAQESVFQLEDERLRKLDRMIANCTLRAPREGIVVYANQANAWGMSEAQIQEGVTVRESQPIFNLPDPNHMRVKAKVNESKVSMIRKGLKAKVTVDAFPDRPMMGTVGEVTAIPAPSGGPMSDVRVYYAMVDIDDGGFNELRPGLSAEVTFEIDPVRKVTRVPIQALRWVDNKPYAAVTTASPSDSAKPSWEWRAIELGLTDPAHAEVLSGLKPGDQVIAEPDALPAPRPASFKVTEKVAEADSKPRG